jgi:hypothetical protein
VRVSVETEAKGWYKRTSQFLSLLATGSKPPSKIDHHDGTGLDASVCGGTKIFGSQIEPRTSVSLQPLSQVHIPTEDDSSPPPPNLPANQTSDVVECWNHQACQVIET